MLPTAGMQTAARDKLFRGPRQGFDPIPARPIASYLS